MIGSLVLKQSSHWLNQLSNQDNIKEPFKRNGDELHAKIQKAEREIEGLKNTLDLVNSGNDRLRRGNRAVGAQDDDRATYAEFEKR